MQISLTVAYDEARLRRALQFILAPQVRTTRIIGAVMFAAGLPLAVIRPGQAVAYVALLLGLWFVVGAGPVGASRALRTQPALNKQEYRLTLDDEWISRVYPEHEARYRWTCVTHVVETPSDWYAMLSQAQALPIPKDLMSEAQRAEFAAFVANRWPGSRS